MTAKELIGVLEEILEERGGEDLDIRMDVDFEMSYGIWSINVVDDVFGDGSDICFLYSPEADEAIDRYDPRLKIPEKKGLN